MTATRHACAVCARRFLSRGALRRHYESNPSHADPPEESRPPADAGWVCFEDTVETFRALPAGVEAVDLTVNYESGTVVVTGGYEERIDTTPVADELVGDPSWTAQNGFLLVSFARRE